MTRQVVYWWPPVYHEFLPENQHTLNRRLKSCVAWSSPSHLLGPRQTPGDRCCFFGRQDVRLRSGFQKRYCPGSAISLYYRVNQWLRTLQKRCAAIYSVHMLQESSLVTRRHPSRVVRRPQTSSEYCPPINPQMSLIATG